MERGAIHQNTLTRAGRPTRLLAALSLRARRFFLVATLYGPFAQFVHDRRQVHPPGAEHDEKVVENIGRLGANGALVLRRGGDREFDRFFSKFAGAMGRPPIQEAANVFLVRAILQLRAEHPSQKR
jgi:hypothetical protein